MKRLFAALAIAALFSGASENASAKLNPLSHCGTERWHIKTMDDSEAALVGTTAQTSSVDAMRALPVPSSFSRSNDTHRYAPVEETEYTIQALLVGFKEEGDRDFHVVLAQPGTPSHTMIGEIPDPKCSTVVDSGYGPQIAKVRTSFTKCFGPPPASSKYKKFTGAMIAQITGVGFFDYVHPVPQTGVSLSNAIELHPILRIKTISGSCPTGYKAH